MHDATWINSEAQVRLFLSDCEEADLQFDWSTLEQENPFLTYFLITVLYYITAPHQTVFFADSQFCWQVLVLVPCRPSWGPADPLWAPPASPGSAEASAPSPPCCVQGQDKEKWSTSALGLMFSLWQPKMFWAFSLKLSQIQRKCSSQLCFCWFQLENDVLPQFDNYTVWRSEPVLQISASKTWMQLRNLQHSD